MPSFFIMAFKVVRGMPRRVAAALITPPAAVIEVPSTSQMPNCEAEHFCTAGAASDRMKVAAVPLTAVGPAVAVGLAIRYVDSRPKPCWSGLPNDALLERALRIVGRPVLRDAERLPP
jgi:hypothetical protein